MSSSPAVGGPGGSVIYIGVEAAGFGRVFAIPSNGGQPIWNKLLPDSVSSSPAIGADGKIYVGCYDGRLYAFDAASGDIRWSKPTGGVVSSSPAIGADGTLYVGAGGLGEGRLFAFSPDGEVRWTFKVDDRVQSSPAVATDGTIYFGSDDRHVYAVSPDGAKKWDFTTGGPVYGSPAIGRDGTIYVGSRDQKMYAINPDGTKKWEVATNGEIWSSPVLGANGDVYFASFDRNFYALQPEDGKERWRFLYGATTESTAAVRGDGVIIFGADDGIVRAVNPDGSPRWEAVTPSHDLIESSPVVAPDGAIYVGSLDGRLYKLSGSGSPLSEYSAWPAFRRDIAHSSRARTITGSASLKNLSTRAHVAPGETLIAGFFVQGPAEKAYLVRGVGPALAQFGVVDFMADPLLRLYEENGISKLLQTNDNWQTPSAVADATPVVGAFPLPEGSKDAALIWPLLGAHTAHISDVSQKGGIALVEAYDAIGGAEESRLTNLAVRGQVGTGDKVLILGLAIAGSGPTRVLVRAVGPGLAQFNIAGVLQNPRLSVFDATHSEIFQTQAGWSTQGLTYDLQAAAGLVAAFPLQMGSQDRARVLTLNPNTTYTVQISGVNGTTGEALAEIYVLP